MNPLVPVLQVDALAKRFCRDTARSLRFGVADILAEFLPSRRAAPQLRAGEFWSLEDIGFWIMPGEAVAIGGRNGAGKTTLLRLLAGLLKPDAGAITLSGTVNPVIELGQGLSPMLTGRENAQIGLAWRGIAAARVDTLVDEVAAFAELGAMFDAPVHSYSAGMRVRLAYAIAVAVPCDLLLLDEVLAVGDLAFQRKCIEHIQGHLARGGAMILVSHNPVQMQALCRRGILLDEGKLVFDGPIEVCIDRMFALQANAMAETWDTAGQRQLGSIDEVRICGRDGHADIASGEAVEIEIAFTLFEPMQTGCEFSIWTRDLSQCIAIFVRPGSIDAEKRAYVSRCTIPELPLAHGTYVVRASLFHPETYLSIANRGYHNPPFEFTVREALSRPGVLIRQMQQLVRISHHWHGAPGGDGRALPIETDSIGADNKLNEGPTL